MPAAVRSQLAPGNPLCAAADDFSLHADLVQPLTDAAGIACTDRGADAISPSTPTAPARCRDRIAAAGPSF